MMVYDFMVRECSTCRASYVVVKEVPSLGDEREKRVVYGRSCGCGHWLNGMGDWRTDCPDGSAMVWEEEEE